MKLAIFADRERRQSLEPLLATGGRCPGVSEYAFYESYDDFIKELPRTQCKAVIVAHKGAMGMQGVRAAKLLLYRVPIVWLSDDNGFVEESYRNGCAYFSTGDITKQLLSDALRQCEFERRNLS